MLVCCMCVHAKQFIFDYTQLSALSYINMWSLVMTCPLNSMIVVCFFFRACHRFIGMCNILKCRYVMLPVTNHVTWLPFTVPSLHSVFLLSISMNGINLNRRENLIQSSISFWWIMVCYWYTTLLARQRVTRYLLACVYVCVRETLGCFLGRKR